MSERHSFAARSAARDVLGLRLRRPDDRIRGTRRRIDADERIVVRLTRRRARLVLCVARCS